MNLNELVVNRHRGRGKKSQNLVSNVPPINLGRRIKTATRPKYSVKSAASTRSNSSRIQWQKKQNISVSTGLRSASSSKSHTSSEHESQIILALTEGRGEARCEIGVAAINITKPSLILCQFSDTANYINTLTKINILNPSEILIPSTFVENFRSNRLIDKVKQYFSNTRITSIARVAFNKLEGLDRIQELCVPSLNSILLVIQHKYYATAAAAALLKYCENVLNVYYANGTIKVEYQQSEGCAIIAIHTADQLELVQSTRPLVDNNRHASLLGILNNCCTKIGLRKLRSTILQPPCSVPDIEARLDCVAELMKNPHILREIQSILVKLSNVDMLLSLSTILSNDAQDCSERQLNYLLLLNTLLSLLPSLQDLIKNSNQLFFVELKEFLNDQSFSDIKKRIQEIIHSDAHQAKGENGVVQRCFAIKSGINGLLDMARKIYSERIDEMREYVKQLGEKYNLQLSLRNNNKKGYHINLTLTPQQKRHLKISDLPEEFIQVQRLSSAITMKTIELITFSIRIDDILIEILKISNIMIRDLLLEISNYISQFYKLSEDIAQLDMLQSLAQASAANNYIRPKFSDFMELLHSRHPLLEFLCSSVPVSNSILASNEYNLHLITGPNGSGKSIFIRQIVLIQIMAQIGCFVPASSATLRVADRIFAKVYLEDNMDCGISAFTLEMQEIKYILTTMTKHSLIIIDELCRSTSLEEGTALAMAVCEKFISTSAYVFFTTHYTLITKLQKMYYNVKNWQLETIENAKNLEFKYTVIPGVVSLKHYGISLVRDMWPDTIVKDAENILNEIESFSEPVTSVKCVTALEPKYRLKYDLEARMKLLKRKGKLTKNKLNALFRQYVADLDKFNIHIEITFYSESSSQNPTTSNSDNCNETTPPSFMPHSIFQDYLPTDNLYQNHSRDDEMFADNISLLVPDISLRYEEENWMNNQFTETPFISPFPTQQSMLSYKSPSASQLSFSLPLLCNTQKTSTPVMQEEYNVCNTKNTSVPIMQEEYNIHNTQNTSVLIMQEEYKNYLPQINLNGTSNENLSLQTIQTALNDLQDCSQYLTQDWDDCTTFYPKPALSPKIIVHNIKIIPKNSCQKDKDEEIIEENLTLPSISYSPLCSITSKNNDQIENINKSINLSQLSIENDNSFKISSTSFKDQSLHIIRKTEKDNYEHLPLQESKTTTNEERSEIKSRTLNDSFFNLKKDKNQNSTLEFISNPSTSSKRNSIIEQESFNNNLDKNSTEVSKTKDTFETNNFSQDNANLLPVVPSPLTTRTSFSSTSSQMLPSNKKIKLMQKLNHEEPLDLTKISNSPSDDKRKLTSVIFSQNLNISPAKLPAEVPKIEEISENNYCAQKKFEVQSKNDENIVPLDLSIMTSEKQDNSSSTSIINSTTESSGNNKRKTETEVKRKCKKPKEELGIEENNAVFKAGIGTKKRTKKNSKFIPPKVLSKRAIEQDYYQQNVEMLQNNDESRQAEYLQDILNRPSVRQLQESKYIALVRRNDDGEVVVIPAEERKRKRPKLKIAKNSFCSTNFDVTLFSDKNSTLYEEFMQKKPTKTQLSITPNRNLSYNSKKIHKTIARKNSTEITRQSQTFLDYLSNINNFNQDTETAKYKTDKNDYNQEIVQLAKNTSGEFSQNMSSKTPDCYYKRNKDKIDDIIGKYNNISSDTLEVKSSNFNETLNPVLINVTKGINTEDLSDSFHSQNSVNFINID